MKKTSNNPVKEIINEEVSMLGMWIRSVRRRAARPLSGVRSTSRDVRGGGGRLTVTPPEDVSSGTEPLIDEQLVDEVAPPMLGLPPAAVAAALLEFGITLASADQRILMLDYDGTLAPFKVERMEATPYEGVREAVAQIMARGDRVVIISGRLATEVATLINLDPTPEIWGCHGWERLVGGELSRLPLAPKQSERLFKAGYSLKNEGFQSRLEYKHGSLALHWRGATESEKSATLTAGLRAMEPASGNNVKLHRFDGGLELRATGRDKGVVVKEILSGIDRKTPVAYLGDDLTDEDAFRAVRKRGLGVLVRSEPRETAASVWLKPPEELIEFFSLWLKSTQTKQ